MRSILSIIYLQTSSVSGERIAIGLLGISEKEVFFSYAEQKLKLAAKLTSPSVGAHVEISCKLIQNKVAESNKEAKKGMLLTTQPVFTKEYVEYLNRYSKGLLQFDLPKSYAGEMDKKTFKMLFQQLIGHWDNEESVQIATKTTGFQQAIKERLKKPVFKEKTDVNYTLQPDKIKGVLLPHAITMISKNGNILAAQALDFTIAPELIGRHVYELEAIYRSLEQLSQTHIKKAHKGQYYLLFNPPAAHSPQETLLNEIRAAKSDFMKLEKVDYLEKIEEDLEKGKYEKFSAFLETM